MNLERYDYEISDDGMEYLFYSNGPKGRIKKVVQFQPFIMNVGTFMNMAFGDRNESGQYVDDTIVSNNKDGNKVLATAAHIVIDFASKFPNTEIYAEGSTPSRNRLYQIAIVRHYKMTRKMFKLYGLTEDDEIEPFVKGINYTAFIIQWKSSKKSPADFI